MVNRLVVDVDTCVFVFYLAWPMQDWNHARTHSQAWKHWWVVGITWLAMSNLLNLGVCSLVNDMVRNCISIWYTDLRSCVADN